MSPTVAARGRNQRPRRRKGATAGNAGHPSQAGVSFSKIEAAADRGYEFAQNCQHASPAIGEGAAEVDAVKRTAAEPDAIRVRYPRTFGDVLGVPAPPRYGAVCR